MWYDIFKLFWYAFMKEPQHKGGLVCGPFIPDLRGCDHPNAYYYGDTCPVTYKCPDCGATFLKEDAMKQAVAKVVLKPGDPLDPDGVFNE